MKRLFLHWMPRFWVVALFSAPVWAVGLGELTVHTYLNEPFRGEVVIFDTESLQIKDLRVEIASEDEFRRVGAERVFWLTQLRFEVQTQGAEKRVLLTTDGPLKEPYLDFVMALSWPQGRLLRDYTALIDLPPATALGEGSVAQSLSDGASQAPDEALKLDPPAKRFTQDVPQPISQLAEPAGASAPAAGSFYLVVPNDTLWRIASRVAPDRVAVEQVMLEIIRMNLQAFQQQNVNGLKAGYRLELPLAEDIEIDRATAIDAVARQNSAWQFQDEPELAVVAEGVTDAAVLDSGLPAAAAEPPEPVSAPVLVPLSVADEASVLLPDADDALWVDQTVVAPIQLEPTVFDLAGESASMGASAADLEALTMTVGRLQSTLAQLQEQIAQRDTELSSLKTLLALRDERLQAEVTALAASNNASLRDRFVNAAISPATMLATLFCLVLCLGWFYRRQQTVPADVSAESAADQGGRVKAARGANANAEVDGSGKPQEHVPNVAPALSATRESEGDRSTGLHSTETVRQAVGNDSTLTTDERAAPYADSSLVEYNVVVEGALEPLTRDDLSLAPADALSPESHGNDSIYGLETDPVDSQLDLARAYIDMGDEESAYPVLTQIIEQGSLSQQAEARALFNRFDVL